MEAISHTNGRYDTALAGDIAVRTKDIDFGDPGRRKKVYKVVIRYSKGATSGTASTNGYKVEAIVNGVTTRQFSSTTRALYATSTYNVHECIPDNMSHFNNIKSMALNISSQTNADDDFKLHDITIVYRDKTVG